MDPRETIQRFDRFLADQGLRFEAIVVGGAALGLLGVVSRQTRDCDVLQPEAPDCVALAPTPQELEEARPWLHRQDANPQWPAHVDRVLADLARRLCHGL